MKKLFYACLLVLLVLPMAVAPLYASPPEPLSGDFQPIAPPTVFEVRQAGPNTIVHQSVTYALTGDLVGTVVTDEWNTHFPDGSSLQRSVHSFTGSLKGVPGSFDLVVVARNDGTTFTGQWTIVSARGDLANLRGQGTIAGDGTTGAGTYAGQVHQDP